MNCYRSCLWLDERCDVTVFRFVLHSANLSMYEIKIFAWTIFIHSIWSIKKLTHLPHSFVFSVDALQLVSKSFVRIFHGITLSVNFITVLRPSVISTQSPLVKLEIGRHQVDQHSTLPCRLFPELLLAQVQQPSSLTWFSSFLRSWPEIPTTYSTNSESCKRFLLLVPRWARSSRFDL